MRKLTLRSIWAHKRRLISTIVAILLGVAFMVGTFVFSDTLNKVFDDLFDTANDNVDTRVQGEVIISGSAGSADLRGRFDESVVDVVADVDGVAAAAGVASTFGGGPINRVLGADGDPIGASNGPPTLVETWVDDELLSPYRLTEGSRGPEADDEIALNVQAAEDGGLSVGDTVDFVSQFGAEQFTLVGTFTFGDRASAAGAVSADFTLATAQRIAGAEGQIDAVYAAAEDGVSQEELTARIADVIPPGTEAITGEAAAKQDADAVQEGLRFFTLTLSIFGAIALLVSIFLIYNTFQVLLAQRTRELALLRAVGASRSQVLGSVVIESVVIGLVSALLGVAAGIGLAAGITAAFGAAGADLPSSGLVITPQTILFGLILGLVVTVVAAVAPAIKATRVPPLAAIREVAIDRSGSSKVRLVLSLVVLLLAAVNLSTAWTGDGDTDELPTVGSGALLLIVGVIMISPLLTGRSIRAIGSWLPKVKGVTGRLATENAARSPKRTSATAAALLIGVALIGFVTVFASSAKASVDAEVSRGLSADLVIQADGGAFGGFFGLPPTVAGEIAAVDGVDQVARWKAAQASVIYPSGNSSSTFAGAIDPELFEELTAPRMAEGELTDLTPGGVVVDQSIAEDNDLSIGDPLVATFPGGATIQATIQAISDDPLIVGFVTFTAEDFEAAVDQPLDFQLFATVDEGADVQEVIADVEAAIEDTPGINVLDREGFVGDLANQLTTFVNVIYGLLALSVIIAMIGVANTLSLSIYERTRELGLLRAVGMAREQMRSSIRWEAVLIAILGTLAGLGLGLIASYALITALEGQGLTTFRVPVVTLLIWAVALAGLAVLASVFAARRAARLDILQAIAEE